MTVSDRRPRPLPVPNPVTRRRFVRQTRRQIFLPLLLGLGLLAALVVGLWQAEVGNVEVWAHIATLALGLPALALLTALLTLLAALVYAVTVVLRGLPPYTRQAQDAVMRLEQQIKTGSDLTVKPVITLKSYFAMIESLFGLGSKRAGK